MDAAFDDKAPEEEVTASQGGEGEAEEGEEQGVVQGHKPINKKRLIIVAVLLVVAIAVGIGGFVFLKHSKVEAAKAEQDAKQEEAKQDVFHDMDELIVNLNTEGKSVSFMKITITLNVEGKENLDVVVKLMPRIRDVFQIYLRELRPADMQGSVGLYRLREELLLRVNKLVYPAQVKDILFKEVLVQ